MSLFFDARYIRVNHHDGISRFSSGLAAALHDKLDVTAMVSDLRQLEKLPPGMKFVKLPDPTALLEPLVALKLNKLGANLVFSPMQTIGSFGRKFKLVVTVHDLIYYRHPTPPPSFNLFVKLLWRLYHLTYWPQRLLLNRADAVATVSETTKGLIAKHRLTSKTVRVVYNAAGGENQSLNRASAPTSKSLVYMGSFMDYKNVETLIKGMRFLPGYELNLLSKISADRRRDLELLVPAECKVNFISGVSDAEYEKFLAEATALVSASRDEGFGIPVIESMSHGTPAIVSDIEIFREIGGDAALYFDQESPEAFAKKVKSLEDSKFWLEASQRSKIQAAKFNWSNSADELIELIASI